MSRPVALLDFDHTLVFHDELNRDLLDSLKRKGITDLYLFTDMVFNQYYLRDRETYIQKLRAEGFTVHGVITPSDLSWSRLNKEEAPEIYRAIDAESMHLKERVKSKTELFESLNLFLDELESDYPSLKEARVHSTTQEMFGVSYDEARQIYITNKGHLKEEDELPEGVFQRSKAIKFLADLSAMHHGYKDGKALMLDLFLKNKPDWVSSIIIADDKDSVIESVKDYIDRNKPEIPITTIHVTQKSMGLDFYDTKLESFEVLNRIDMHIDKLEKSNRNIFLVNPNAKIRAMQMLRESIFQASHAENSLSCRDVIEQWEKSMRFMDYTNKTVDVSTVIGTPRNIFVSQSSNKETSTQTFIRELKEEHGDCILGIEREDSISLILD